MKLVEFPSQFFKREIARPHRRILFDTEVERLRAALNRRPRRRRIKAEVRYLELRPRWVLAFEVYQAAVARSRKKGLRLPARSFKSAQWSVILCAAFLAEAYLFGLAFSAAGESDRAAAMMGAAVAAWCTAGPYALARLFRYPVAYGFLGWVIALGFISAGSWLVYELGPLRVQVITATLAAVGAVGTALSVGAVWALTALAAAFSLLIGYFRLDPDIEVERSHEELAVRTKELMKIWRRYRPVVESVIGESDRAVLADNLIQINGLCAVDEYSVAYIRGGGQALPDHDLGRHLFDPSLLGDPLRVDARTILAEMECLERVVEKRAADEGRIAKRQETR